MNEESTLTKPALPKSVVREEANVECVFHLGKVRDNSTPGTSIQNGTVVCCGRKTFEGTSTPVLRRCPRRQRNAVDVCKYFKTLTDSLDVLLASLACGFVMRF